MRRVLAPAIARADVVHVHSNGLLAEVAVLLARRRRPAGGADAVWHGDLALPAEAVRPRSLHAGLSRRVDRDVLQRAAARARARELGLTRRQMETVYPAVGSRFVWHDGAAQAAARSALNIPNRHLLLNVKRLHPLAGQRDLLEALNDVVRVHPDTRLVICGTGPLLDELQGGRAIGRRRAARHVRRARGQCRRLRPTAPPPICSCCRRSWRRCRPSRSRRSPPARRSSRPTIPGGIELNDVFGPDVAVVPREQPIALGLAIARFLEDKRRTSASTRRDHRARLPGCGGGRALSCALRARASQETSDDAGRRPRRVHRPAGRAGGRRVARALLRAASRRWSSTSTPRRRGCSPACIPTSASRDPAARSPGPGSRSCSGCPGSIAASSGG